jgi:hypothetical protein
VYNYKGIMHSRDMHMPQSLLKIRCRGKSLISFPFCFVLANIPTCDLPALLARSFTFALFSQETCLKEILEKQGMNSRTCFMTLHRKIFSFVEPPLSHFTNFRSLLHFLRRYKLPSTGRNCFYPFQSHI